MSSGDVSDMSGVGGVEKIVGARAGDGCFGVVHVGEGSRCREGGN
jgi:hypothetical protein